MASSRSHLALVPLYPAVSPIVLRSRQRRAVNRAVQDASLIGIGVSLGLALPFVAQGQVAHVLLTLAFFASLVLTVLLSALLAGWVHEWALQSRVDRAANALRAELSRSR